MEIIYRSSVSAEGGFRFVISDGSMDRHGTRINPDAWDLSLFRQNPVALFAHDGTAPIGFWSDIKVEAGRLLGTLNLAAKGTSQRIDEIRSLVEQGILRAVSVGFRPKPRRSKSPDYEIDGQELIEVSLVSVPSNPRALAVARSLNISPETLSLAFGEHAPARRDMATTPGKHAAPASRNPKGSKMDASLSARIEAAQNELNAARDKLADHLAGDDADVETTEDLSQTVEEREQRLTALKRAETALGSRAANPGNGQQPAAPAVRRPLGIQPAQPKPGDLIVRAAVVHFLASITGKDVDRVLEERYRDHEATHVVTRAAVDGAKTTVSGWASELIETETTAFLETLRPASVFPRLASLGSSLSFGPGRGVIKIPSRSSTPSISGSFVAESSPIPVRRLGLTSINLTPHKMGVISYFSREIAKLSNPMIEGMLRREIVADTAITIDTLLLDNTVGSTTRPAGLTYNLAALSGSTAGGFASIIEDINALAAPFDAANAGRSLAILMNPREARNLAMTPGPDGTFGWAERFLSEFTRIVSTTIPAGNVYMIDAADFVAVNGSPEFDASEQAVIHADDTTPLAIGTAGSPNTVAAPVVSMYQTAQIALRMLLDITWAMRRTGMVQWIDDADWAPVVP